MNPLLLILGCLIGAWLTVHYADQIDAVQDYSDTGVRCVDDCLEPANPQEVKP